MTVVLDSSMALSWVLPGEATPKTQAVRDRIETGAKVIVPSHWPLELANALCMAERRKRISQADTAAALAAFGMMSIEVDSETGPRAGRETIALARQYALSVYDAAYLEVAMRQNAALASLDAALRAAVKKLKICLWPEDL
jgi:predicted nucleic acid-binding protein